MSMTQTALVFSLVLVTEVMSYQLCGNQLSNKLAEICSGRGFNERTHALRASGPYLTKRNTVQYLSISSPHQLQKRTGIVSECCHNSCTRPTLESYCAPHPNPTRHVTSNVASVLSTFTPAATRRPLRPIEMITQHLRRPTVFFVRHVFRPQSTRNPVVS